MCLFVPLGVTLGVTLFAKQIIFRLRPHLNLIFKSPHQRYTYKNTQGESIFHLVYLCHLFHSLSTIKYF